MKNNIITTRKVLFLTLTIILGSCSDRFTPKLINDFKVLEPMVLYLYSQNGIYNIYTADMLGIGITDKTKITVLTSDTTSSYFEIMTDEINETNSTIVDSLHLNTSVSFLNFKAVLEFVKQKDIYGVSVEDDCVVLSFVGCCPRLRIVVTSNPSRFFKNVYNENYTEILKNKKGDENPWAQKIDGNIYEYFIRDVM